LTYGNDAVHLRLRQFPSFSTICALIHHGAGFDARLTILVTALAALGMLAGAALSHNTPAARLNKGFIAFTLAGWLRRFWFEFDPAELVTAQVSRRNRQPLRVGDPGKSLTHRLT
jgi:uncharacterized membrane protein YfcA